MRNRLFAITSLAVVCLPTAGCRTPDARDPLAGWTNAPIAPGPRPAPEAVAHAVDSLAARLVADGLAPALGVAIVMDGRTILARSYGAADVTRGVPADDQTLWYIASSSKSLTGFATALLAQQGVIAFDTPITALLPHARWPDGVDATQLTLAHFLSHTHQLNDAAVVMASAFTGAFPESEWPAMLRHARPVPGHELRYSNLGYNVAAMVIDAARPEGWRRYLDSAVYRPAGMTETYARLSGIDPRRIARPHDLRANGGYVTSAFPKTDATMHAAGGHLATLGNLARWVTVQMDSGVIDGRPVFPAEAVALSHRQIAPQTSEGSRRFAYFDRDGWAAGWDIGRYRGERMVSRFGGYLSTRSHVSFLPGRRIGVVAQANGGVGSLATDVLAAFAYDLERGAPDARALARERLDDLRSRYRRALREAAEQDSARTRRAATDPRRALADYAGSYRHAWYGTITFTLRDSALAWTWGVLDGIAETIDARTCRWTGCDYYTALIIDVGGDMSVTFDFPDTGPARSLRLRNETFTRQDARDGT